MNSYSLADDQTIFGQLPHLLTGVVSGNSIGLTVVEPEFVLITAAFLKCDYGSISKRRAYIFLVGC